MANERGADNPTPENTPPGSGNPSSQENNQVPTSDQMADNINQLPPDQRREAIRDMIQGFRNLNQATPREGNYEDLYERPEIPGTRRRQFEQLQKEQIKPFVVGDFFFPPKSDENESYEAYEERKKAAEDKFYTAEAAQVRLDQVRKGAVYLVQTLEGARSEKDIHWIIEDTLRAGENDWVSPDTFNQACQSALQAIDTVFASDQTRRRKFAEMIRGRQAGYACEFYARFVNAGELGKNITNFFKEYYEAMMVLPGVTEMLEMIEDVDQAEGSNLRGAYFRKLNFEKKEGEDDERNKAKRDEWYKYYAEDERNDKDKRWGVWKVDKKFELYKKAKIDKRVLNSEYIDMFKDPADEELIKVLLVKTDLNGNNPVDAIKQLHRVVHAEQYSKDVPMPKDYHLPKEVIERLKANEKLKKAVHILKEDEKELRGSLEEDVSTLTHSTGNQLDRLIYEINRSMILAQRIEHSFQFSTHWDNIKWKKKIDLTPEQQKLLEEAKKDIKGTDHRNLDEFGKDVDGGQIILNPIVSWAIKSDPRYEGTNKKDKNKKREQMEKETDPHKKQILQKELENLSGEAKPVNLRVAAEKRARLNKMKRQQKVMEEDLKQRQQDADPTKHPTEEEQAAFKAFSQQIDHLAVDYEIVAIDEMRGAKNHLFTMEWDKAYRGFFEKYWDLIDFEGSFSGDSSREARKAQFFGRTLEQSGEAEPGKRFMRRYADTGVKDIGKFFAFESGFDMVDQFSTVFNRVKRWSHLMQTGDKLRGTLMQMLNDPVLLADPVKFTAEIKKNYRPHMSTDDTADKEYYTEEGYYEAALHLESQLDYVTGAWASAIVEYNRTHSWQQHAKNLQQEVLVKNLNTMVAHEDITPHKAAQIMKEQFGPLPKRVIHELTHVFLKPKHGLLSGFGELMEEVGKALASGLKG